jgi:hypothetical protein
MENRFVVGLIEDLVMIVGCVYMSLDGMKNFRDMKNIVKE